jgi:hypothetical protein
MGGPSWREEQRESEVRYWRVTRVPVLIVLGWFTLSHVALGSSWVFIDNVNLVFHEAGHVLFGWGGDTLSILGGTLGQLAWPAALAVYFQLRRRQRFAAVACAWWWFENLVGIARYMADAAFEELALVGGDIHDWNYLLGKWGLLSSGQEIARAVRLLGALGMIGSLALLVWWSARPSSSELAERGAVDD